MASFVSLTVFALLELLTVLELCVGALWATASFACERFGAFVVGRGSVGEIC